MYKTFVYTLTEDNQPGQSFTDLIFNTSHPFSIEIIEDSFSIYSEMDFRHIDLFIPTAKELTA